MVVMEEKRKLVMDGRGGADEDWHNTTPAEARRYIGGQVIGGWDQRRVWRSEEIPVIVLSSII